MRSIGTVNTVLLFNASNTVTGTGFQYLLLRFSTSFFDYQKQQNSIINLL